MKSVFNKIVESFKIKPFHYLVCVVFFVFYNINELNGFADISEVLISLGGLIIIAFGIKKTFTYFTRDSNKSAIIATLVLSIGLFYSHFFYFLVSFPVIKNFLKEGYLIVVISLVVPLLAFYILKTSREFKNFSLYFNLLFSLYLLIEVIQYVYSIPNMGNARLSRESTVTHQEKEFVNKNDVYLIIADAYANSENLKKYWNYDNSKFIKDLTNRGFFHFKYSKSNYDNTLSSMASILNMDYLPMHLNLSSSRNPLVIQNLLVNEITENKVFQKFETQGYAIHNLSLFKILDTNQHYFNRFFYRNFYNHLLSKTLPMRVFVRYTVMDHHAVLKELERVSKLVEIRPKAVYCHILLPHFPYVYDSMGVKRRLINPSLRNSDSYLNQLIYTNKLLKEAIDNIQLNSPKAIIVLTSDHGYRLLENEVDRKTEAFENFTSIYFPDQDYSNLTDSITAVNLFPLVFGKLEGKKKVNLLDDKIDHFR